jgi:hypothetical protein
LETKDFSSAAAKAGFIRLSEKAAEATAFRRLEPSLCFLVGVILLGIFAALMRVLINPQKPPWMFSRNDMQKGR